jgi:hypothetical protein
LVSHYNNQYDPIYGFARQYILSGDPRWQILTEDLVRHVLDIDIYHTNRDRPEYNQGLFWHTDHYLDGRHCTHRTFSIHHLDIDHVEQSGGGPGTEHCYTSGLMMHYFMTGNSASKQAVIHLAKWAKLSNEGSNTLLERLIDFLRKDIPAIKRLLKKDYVFKYKFALSRATGNYLNTLMDYYLLETKPEILEKAATVIKETLGPNDPINERQLMTDIESNWHYTVLLQSLYRYLHIKESINDLDERYQYALASFKHYAKWVYMNEKPFLESADQLVYPNDTWVAQDLRKASILTVYTKYCGIDSKHKVLKKANTFKDTIAEHFSNTNNRTTRIMALLIQNNMSYPEGTDLVTPSSMAKTNASPKASILSVLYSFVKDMLTRVFSVKIKNEIAFIKHRI